MLVTRTGVPSRSSRRPSLMARSAALLRAIHRSVGVGDFARHRAQVDHVAAAAHHHARHHRARHVEQPLHVGVDHLFPVFDLARVELVHAAAQAGVVHQHVDLRPLRPAARQWRSAPRGGCARPDRSSAPPRRRAPAPAKPLRPVCPRAAPPAAAARPRRQRPWPWPRQCRRWLR